MLEKMAGGVSILLWKRIKSYIEKLFFENYEIFFIETFLSFEYLSGNFIGFTNQFVIIFSNQYTVAIYKLKL